MPPSVLAVSDFPSNLNDQMATAARAIGKSKARQAIFKAVYYGPKPVKTVKEIMEVTELSQTRVLTEGGKLVGIVFEKLRGAYRKRKEFGSRYGKILEMAKDKKKLEKLPTKISPRGGDTRKQISLFFPNPARNAMFITIDDIDSFKKVRGIKSVKATPLSEQKIKRGIAGIIGEKCISKDWGGEKSDLFSTRIRVRNNRLPLAIAFKGKGTRGKLVPKKMGKNGDQINRLFDEPALVFFVVYCGEIDSSIISQMRAQAIVEALKGRKIYFGVIDSTDLGRLMVAYPSHF